MEAASHAVTEATAYAMAEASDMGDTHAVGETATPKMGDIYAAVGETVTSDMGDTYAAGTHGGERIIDLLVGLEDPLLPRR